MSDRIDRIVTNRYLALPIFVVVMWAVYYLSIQTIGTIGSDYLNDTVFGSWLPSVVGGTLKSWAVAPWLSGLIVDGLIGGIGSVLGFLPQIIMLFLCLGICDGSVVPTFQFKRKEFYSDPDCDWLRRSGNYGDQNY